MCNVCTCEEQNLFFPSLLDHRIWRRIKRNAKTCHADVYSVLSADNVTGFFPTSPKWVFWFVSQIYDECNKSVKPFLYLCNICILSFLLLQYDIWELSAVAVEFVHRRCIKCSLKVLSMGMKVYGTMVGGWSKALIKIDKNNHEYLDVITKVFYKMVYEM